VLKGRLIGDSPQSNKSPEVGLETSPSRLGLGGGRVARPNRTRVHWLARFLTCALQQLNEFLYKFAKLPVVGFSRDPGTQCLKE
jgi:hypothetical protein